jgi:hypothetical protein
MTSIFPVLNIGAGVVVVLTVRVTGTVTPGVKLTVDGLKEAEDPLLLQDTLPTVVQVQLPGRCAAESLTLPENVLLAVTFRLYATELPGVTVWLCSCEVMTKVGTVAGSELGTVFAGQNVIW